MSCSRDGSIQLFGQVALAQAKGRVIHANFLRRFGIDSATLPLLELNTSDWITPFSVAVGP